MAHLTGYKLFHDYGKDGVGENDGISGGQETFVIFTDEDLPLGSGTVTYGTSLGEVSGVFYEYSGDTYFVPDDDTGFPVDENGVVTSFTEAIRGTRKDDTVNGTGDDDVIYDTDQHPYNPTGSDRIHAGAGDDTIVFGNGNDTILGEGGDDHIGSWSFGDGNNLIDAGDGNDTVIGGYGDDQIIGGAGDDWLAGSGGRDTIDGGDGHDEIVVYDNGDYASVLGGEGARDWDTLNLQTYDTTSGVEVNFTGNEAGTFAFNGSSTYGDFREIEEVSATEYDDRIDASADNAGVVIKAGGGDDVATGGSGNDHISGGTGNDSISGGAGADTLTGGAGVDTLSGGDGNDVFQIGESHEITDIQGEGWWDTIEFDDEGSGEGAIVTYGGDSFGSYTLGSASGDFLSVEQTETTQNSDLVDASASNDSVVTSMLDGNDTFLGGGGDDRAWLGQGEDSVIAGAGDDEIHGEAGSDTIWGGEGNDQLYGGEGSDVFGFADGDGFDVIHDFTIDGTENDLLDVSGLTDAAGNPVDVGDVTVGDDGNGNAILTFPNGEGIQLNGIDPATLNNKTLIKMGIPCFAEGTCIRTPRGDVPIERLRVGDLVQTLDNGVQPIVWIGRRHLAQDELAANPKLQPVRIREGALGNTRDLIVSPQHGMVTTLGDTPTLARAIHLARNGGPGFRVARGIKSVTYFHLMFERHEIIIAENAPSESFYPGPMALNALAPAERSEIAALFPELLADLGALEVYGPTARQFLHRKDLARDVAARFEATRAFG